MQNTDIKNTAERTKLIWALALGLVAIVFLWWTFFGFGGSSSPKRASVRNDSNSTLAPGSRAAADPTQPQKADDLKTPLLEQLRPIVDSPILPAVAEAKRNIFIYYEKPVAVKGPSDSSPTPTPPPPLLLAAVSPANVYAKTGDFTLEVTGDRFTREVRIAVDGRELSTRFMSPQQLSATVPASVIANDGSRQVIVRSANGKLYSNATMLNVSPPPTPNYTYIGIIGTQRRLDTAILQDKFSKEIVNVQRGDLLGGRFRLTSISETELIVVDTNLKIKHTLAMTTDRDKGPGPPARPTPQVDSEEDDEP